MSMSCLFINQLNYSTKYRLSNYCVPGSALGDEDTMANYFLLSWSLSSWSLQSSVDIDIKHVTVKRNKQWPIC